MHKQQRNTQRDLKKQLHKNLRRTLPYGQVIETTLPLCPDIRLLLIDPERIQKPFSDAEFRTILENTPFWTFCWASGQALAAYILENRQRFAGKCVVDFGAGSGVAAIAAALAGADHVIACEIDDHAFDAVCANAALNGVSIELCHNLDECNRSIDILLAADVLYNKKNLFLMDMFLSYAPEVYLADSRVKNIERPGYRNVDEITVSTIPDLGEAEEFNNVGLYYAASSHP